ncbi:hypothetical protein Misp01_42550 [Microtetraspora sp. NBRC 13810]|uniref:anti-sigma factor antagonist n=1 Tax=Microtetraspora sp. NBRC 13810 TaxID=3030990 RepID=UPI00249FD0EA|nr:anti-sigma factor antagonist [Microtetraspora sp. NBRC 13810]GLW09126.1 hypothetical protein Misp01_42550 [Microtetraspora sp. NBRC 13810]
MPLDIRSWTPGREDTLVVRIAGEIDLVTVDGLRAFLRPVTGSGPQVLIVDLTEVWFMSVVGVRCLDQAMRRMKDHGGEFHVVCPRGGAVDRLIRFQGLQHLMPVHERILDALRAPDPASGRPSARRPATLASGQGGYAVPRTEEDGSPA